MAIVVKDAAQAAAKYKQNASAAGGFYAEGVKGAGERWAAGAAAAGDNWQAGIQAAISRGAYGKGIAEAGPAKYVKNATTLGPQRYTQGVQNAEGEWQKGTAPYLDTMRNTTLPPRRPKGDPSNYMRSQVLGQALRAKKTGQTT